MKDVGWNGRRLSLSLSSQIIERLGGEQAIAKRLGISSTAVWWWSRRGIPLTRAGDLLVYYPELSDVLVGRKTSIRWAEEKVA